MEAKAIVDEVLEFLAKKPILIKDMFCLGKYARSTSMPNPARPRPILVKLSTAWDRKLILLRKSNLREFRIRHLFLREDVPPDHMLRQRKPTSSLRDGRSSADTPDSVPGTVQTPTATLSVPPNSLSSSLVPQVTSKPSTTGDGIFSSQSHSSTSQDSSSLHSSHSAPLVVEGRSSASSPTSSVSTIVQDDEISHNGST